LIDVMLDFQQLIPTSLSAIGIRLPAFGLRMARIRGKHHSNLYALYITAILKFLLHSLLSFGICLFVMVNICCLGWFWCYWGIEL